MRMCDYGIKYSENADFYQDQKLSDNGKQMIRSMISNRESWESILAEFNITELTVIAEFIEICLLDVYLKEFLTDSTSALRDVCYLINIFKMCVKERERFKKFNHKIFLPLAGNL